MYNFTLIKLCFSAISGILLGFYLEFTLVSIIIIGIILFLFLILSYFQANKKFQQSPVLGIFAILLFIYIGFTISYSRLPKNNPSHYTNLSDSREKESLPLMFAEVQEILKSNNYQDRYIVEVHSLDSVRSHGKLLLNLEKDSLFGKLKIGQHIALNGPIEDIRGAQNPGQFNYSQYMRTLGVSKQLNVSKNQLLVLAKTPNSARAFAGKLRDNISYKLKQQEFSKDELAVIQALLLGQRQELSTEIQKNYAAAGVIHILAVSGLHVGIILFMLSWVLKFLDRIPYGNIAKTLILLALLWGFALVAGLSPSVVRAVSMFSFVAVGMQLKKRTSILNTLFASLLILILLNPNYVFQVGFQLSYAAVFAIVIFQPYIVKWINPKNNVIKYFWKIASVTIAAQIGVLPLSLFYFHQFPGLFMVSNIIILPFMGLLLAVGIILIIIILIGFNPLSLSHLFGWMISKLNYFVAYIASKEAFLIENISFSGLLCISASIFILSLSFLIRKFNFKNLALVFSAILIIQMSFLYEKHKKSASEFVVFHESRNSGIGLSNMQNFNYYSGRLDYRPTYLKDYVVTKNIKLNKVLPLKNIYSFSEKDILVIDSLGVYRIPTFNPKLVILTNSPKINLDKLLEDLNPEQVIVDGSNYKSLVSLWKNTADNKKIPFHATAEKGAFILKNQ